MNWLRVLKVCWNKLPLSDKSRWQVTRLILEPMLPLIKGSTVATAYLREKEWQSKRIRPFHGDRFPPLPLPSKPDIFIWSVIDWRYRIQRPQHLARGFAERGYRVFYVSTAFVNTRRPGFELEQLDEYGRLYNVRLHLSGRPLVYAAPPSRDDSRRLLGSIASLLEWTRSHEIISVSQHPYWFPLVHKLPNSHLVYDCLDHHEGFGNTGIEIASLERSLLKNAELVVTTSQYLHDVASNHNDRVALIRNAAEFEFFSKAPPSAYRDHNGRRIIGYYGAIAEWMDLELLEKIAHHFTDSLLLLVGADDTGAARQRLSHMGNVVFTGEIRYAELPHFLYGMDVCLLPFKVTPLTLATNPLKVYEYLAAGKPVVSVDLPELKQFENLVFTAKTHDEFIAAIEVALCSELPSPATRQEFASHHTWKQRVDAFESLLANLPHPLVSIVIVTYNNLELTRACLESLDSLTHYPNFETIVVDNASTDGTPNFLATWARASNNQRVILNTKNLGFAAANNQGLEIANGDFLVLLNNDTEVSPGWLRTLMSHLLREPQIGLVGPVTDNIGNEARIRIRSKTREGMLDKARTHTLHHMGEAFEIRTLAFFCVMMRRTVYETVGPLDEAYGLGFFEDDDYCRRVERDGWKLLCAEDVFIHHHLSASFKKLGKARQELLEKNRKIYEAKWGPWIPHQHR